MANFPNNPALNELFTSGWSTWMFDGVKWMASVPSGGVYEPVFGGTQYPMYGFLYQETVGDPGYSAWAGFGAHRWRFGISPGDDFAAGSIDYRGFVSDALSIVGAGATAGSRKINLYDNVNISGNLTVGTTTILGGGGGIVSVGNITATGPLSISGPVGTTGSNAIFTFQDRTGSTTWGWYAQAGIARLWNDASGDRVTFDSGGSIATPGSIRTGSNIYVGGNYLFFAGVTAGGPLLYGTTTDMVSQLGTGNGAFYWFNNPGVQLMKLDNVGSFFLAGNIYPGANVGAGDAAIELGSARTGLGNSYVDFHSQPGTDFDFRIIRAAGPNGAAQIINNGTAALWFQAGDTGSGADAFQWYNNITPTAAKLMALTASATLTVTSSIVSSNNGITAGGNNAIFWFGDRTGGATWGLYSTGNIARLYNGADRFQFDGGGNLSLGGNHLNFAGTAPGVQGPRIYADTVNMAHILGSGNGNTTWYDYPGNPLIDITHPNAGGLLQIYGTTGWDSLRVRAPNGNFIVFKPETGVSWCQFGYYIAASASWGTIEVPGNLNVDGSFYASGISTGDIHVNNAFLGGNYLCMAGNTDGARGPTIYADPTNYVFKLGSGNGTYYFANLNGAGVAGIDGAGNIWGSGTVNSRQFIATLNPQYRLINVNDQRYGSMWYNDGTNTYLLLTALNDAYGSWNGLRPYVAENATGNVTFGQNVIVGGAVTMNSSAWIAGTLTVNGGYLGLPNSSSSAFLDIFNSAGNWLHIFDDGNAHVESNTRIWFQSQTGADVWFGGPLWSNSNIACAGALTCGQGDFILSRTGSHGYIVRTTNSDGNIHFCVQGGGNLQNIYMDANTLWVGGSAVINNGGLLYGKDTAGNAQWLISMWGDNVIYVGDGSHDLHLRGYTTYVDNNNEFRCNNAMHAVGTNAMVQWDDRTDGFVWGWYAHNSVAYFWDSLEGDRMSVDRGGSLTAYGNVRANGSIGVNGIWFGNNGGWWWTGSPIHTDSNIECNIFTAWDIHASSGLFCNGLLFQNNGGWWWTGSPFHTDGAIQCNDFYVGGCRFYNNGGWSYFDQSLQANALYSRNDIWCAGNISAGNDVHAPGVFRCGNGRNGGRVECWAGDWGDMTFAMSNGYFEVSADAGQSGFMFWHDGNWSDARLKTDIRDTEVDALAVIRSIPVRAFGWNEEGRRLVLDAAPVECGLVAQELEEQIPFAVNTAALLGAGMKLLVDDRLTPYLFRAMQQLAARVEFLEHQLEGRA